jgi:stage III sporulation protein AA
MAKITIMQKEDPVIFKKNIPENIFDLLPVKIRNLFKELPLSIFSEIEEIRLRSNRPILVVTTGRHLSITYQGILTENLPAGYIVTLDDIEKALHKVSQSSIYAWEEEFRRGYITISGGHRIGLAGKVILDKGLIKSMKEISGLNLRVAREIQGVADRVMPYLLSQDKRVMHTLLVSPPQCGKTTLLRDIVRQLSSGVPYLGFPGVNVGLVDERSELAGMYGGIPQFDIGLRTDCLDGCPKAQGMMMLIRSMSPQVIATDEIGTLDDIFAMEEVLNAGISVLTTIHGKDIKEIRQRPNLGKVIEQKYFQRIIILSRSLGVGTIENILDGNTLEPILTKPIRGKAV